MRRRTSRCVAICSRPQLAVQKRLGSFVTTLTCSFGSSTGHGGRLAGRTYMYVWRSGTARWLTYAQQWTSFETSVVSCPACTLCYAMTPSPTLTARARCPFLKVKMNNDNGGRQVDVLREPDISKEQLNATVSAFFLALYGEKKTDSLNTARYKMYPSRKKPPPLKKLLVPCTGLKSRPRPGPQI